MQAQLGTSAPPASRIMPLHLRSTFLFLIGARSGTLFLFRSQFLTAAATAYRATCYLLTPGKTREALQHRGVAKL
jgi:hypothetical protein